MPEVQTRTGTRTRRPAAEEGARTKERPEDSAGPVCTVAFCPICMAVTAAQGAAPDAVEHLLKAAREFFLAARAVIDVRADHLAGEHGSARVRLEKIDIA